MLVLQVSGGFILAVILLAGLTIGVALAVAREDPDTVRLGQSILVVSAAGLLGVVYFAFIR